MRSFRKNRIIGRVIVFAIALCMLFGIAIPASATDEDVRATASGVLCFGISYEGYFVGNGSCFLINEDTIITANHCVHFSKALYDAYNDYYGITKEQLDKGYSFTVTIARDFTIPATLVNASENMDFAILKLSQPISNRTYLSLRDSNTVQATETAYSVGYPASKVADAKTAQYYNQKDVIFESGTINRAQYTESTYVDYQAYQFSGDVLMLSAGTFSGGNSGGPMVDANGNVIGIVSYYDGGSCYASAISQVMEVLDAISIKYSKAGEQIIEKKEGEDGETPVDYSALQAAITKAENRVKEEYTAESYQKLSDAIVSAKAALSAKTQAEVDLAKSNLDNAINDLVQAKKTNWALIIIIAVVVLAVVGVAVVVIVVLSGNKKKNKPEEFTDSVPVPAFSTTAEPKQIPVNATAGTTVAPAGSNETTVLSADGGETTVLSGDGSETTVLSKQVDGGKLIRLSNNENIPITYSGFTIGKNRREVDYCIGDNTNISRNHAKFIVRDGVTYIVDNKSTNGTFVNNSTVRPGDEIALNDGDMIMLADEKFEFKK